MKTRVNGINLNYTDAGEGTPVIFVHAFPLNHAMWDGQVSDLARYARAITVDLRGFGDSDLPPGPYSLADMAADIRGLMNHLKVEQAVLVGLSMGGYVSLAFYREHRDAIRALVLADTRATADTEAARERRYKSAARAMAEGAMAIANDMAEVGFSRKTPETRPEVIQRMRLIAQSNSAAGIANAQRAMAERLDSTELLATIDFPVLVIVGSEDGLTPPSEAESMARAIHTAEMVTIDGAGHFSNMEEPEQFNRAFESFLRKLK